MEEMSKSLEKLTTMESDLMSECKRYGSNSEVRLEHTS